jgi:glycosyltransferase involved in cell wall biosynthesis
MTYRILHCLRAPVGGLYRHVRDLAAGQAALGHEVAVVCDSRAGDGLSEGRLEALAGHARLGLHRTPMSRDAGWRDATAFAFTRDIAAELQLDVIHGHGAKGGAYARLAAHALRGRASAPACLYTPHGGSLHYLPTSLSGRLYLGLERRLAPMTDGFIFESAYSARVFSEKVAAGIERQRVVHNGLLPEEFGDHRPAPDATEFLFVGELRMLKGVDLLLIALAEVRKSRPARLTIVGDGPDTGELRSLAVRLGLGPAVRFEGAMSPPPFDRGRSIVVPSRAESLPYIALEAAAAGIPLIATDVGGIGEIVAGTDTPMVPRENHAALARAMLEVLADAPAAIARAGRLRHAVSRRFHVTVMTRDILDFYAATIARTRAR